MTHPRGPGQRAGLDSAHLLTAARELLTERGLPGLTMRALAERLDVAPNTLYSHVASKAALLDAVLDDVLAEVTPPPSDAEVTAGLHSLMSSTYDVLLAHPDLVPGYLQRQGSRGPNSQRLGRIALDLLAAGGVEDGDARAALRVLVVFTIGFAAFAGGPQGGAETDGPAIDRERLGESFEAGLRWLLAGVTGTGGGR